MLSLFQKPCSVYEVSNQMCKGFVKFILIIKRKIILYADIAKIYYENWSSVYCSIIVYGYICTYVLWMMYSEYILGRLTGIDLFNVFFF